MLAEKLTCTDFSECLKCTVIFFKQNSGGEFVIIRVLGQRNGNPASVMKPEKKSQMCSKARLENTENHLSSFLAITVKSTLPAYVQTTCHAQLTALCS